MFGAAAKQDVKGLFSGRVDLHTQDGATGRNSTEAQALINAAQTIFGLGGVPPPVWLRRQLVETLASCWFGCVQFCAHPVDNLRGVRQA